MSCTFRRIGVILAGMDLSKEFERCTAAHNPVEASGARSVGTGRATKSAPSVGGKRVIPGGLERSSPPHGE